MGVLLSDQEKVKTWRTSDPLPLEHPPLRSCSEVQRDRSYFDEYNTRHEAMRMLSEAWWKTQDTRLREVIHNAIGHVRDAALDLIPYGLTTPNKDSYGRRHGRMV